MTSVREIFDTMEYGPAPEGDAAAREGLARHDARVGHFVAGGWTKPAGLFDVGNPATGKRIAQVSQGTKKDVDSAVRAARKALSAWQALGGHGRARYLYALARTVQRNARLLAVLESMDNGKSIRGPCDMDDRPGAGRFSH